MNYFKPFLLLLTMLGSINIYSQKNDYIWLTGYESNAPDTFQGFRLGNTKLDFNQTPVNISFDSIQMNFDWTNTSYSDSNGNLLFYTNGIYIANALDEKIENSDSLNAGWDQYVHDPTITQLGYRIAQGIVALPDVGHPNYYYLLHALIDSVSGSNGTIGYYSQILVTYLNMAANGGHGLVVYKNRPLLTGDFSGDLSAVKHGNGRDWWILVQKRNTNCFYQLLLDTAGFHVSDSICLGTIVKSGEVSNSCFSPDGSKFVSINSYSGLNIYNFDRCTGQLTNAIHLSIPIIADSALYRMGIAISPNNRFLYASITTHIYQFDLFNNDIFNHIDTIANYDGWYFLYPILSGFFHFTQLAPDGKIYISCGTDLPFYHVINAPDSMGAACNFVPHGVPLGGFSIGIPNYPNYRLGALTQSQCDSLSSATQQVRDAKEQILKVFPNPANDVATIDYGFTDWNKGPVSLNITNTLGQTIYTQLLPMYSGFQKINVSQFAAGTYTVYIKRSNAVVAANKLVVVH